MNDGGVSATGDGDPSIDRFSALAEEALAAGRSGPKWKPIQSFLADLLGVADSTVGAAGTHDFRSEFTRLRGQAPSRAATLGLVFLGDPADLDVAEERISEAIRTESWRPSAPIAVCADLDGRYRVHRVIGAGAPAMLRRLSGIAAQGATAADFGAGDPPAQSQSELRDLIAEVLRLQHQYSFRSTDPMRDRGVLIRATIPDTLAAWLEGQGWGVEGRDGAGRRSRVPWVRVFDPDRSPSAQAGWYVVYLFSSDGSVVTLSLNQGTTEGSDMKQQSKDTVLTRVEWARGVLSSRLADATELAEDFDLVDPGGLGEGYEAASVAAITYTVDSLPADATLRADLLGMLELLGALYEAEGDRAPSGQPQHSFGSEVPLMPEPADASKNFDWLLQQTLWHPGELREIIETLTTRRPQVVLAGPPGTGKTWVAENLALHLTGGRPSAVRVVQFHPTYSYEDFVEGLRPVPTDSGSIAFDVVEGVLVQAADQARSADHPVVLVVDEMNRANLPSVFGELLYLLEYRDKRIGLLHRPSFSLPANLMIIGTMNTADRSIRSIDSALRRRFDIFECPPSARILDAYFAEPSRSTSVAGLGAGMEELNDRLAGYLDRHHGIGHTFFMRESFGRLDLERTWVRQVKPLIEEYFFDQPDIAGSFSVANLWPE